MQVLGCLGLIMLLFFAFVFMFSFFPTEIVKFLGEKDLANTMKENPIITAVICFVLFLILVKLLSKD